MSSEIGIPIERCKGVRGLALRDVQNLARIGRANIGERKGDRSLHQGRGSRHAHKRWNRRLRAAAASCARGRADIGPGLRRFKNAAGFGYNKRQRARGAERK